jgi:hypothetical protein
MSAQQAFINHVYNECQLSRYSLIMYKRDAGHLKFRPASLARIVNI